MLRCGGYRIGKRGMKKMTMEVGEEMAKSEQHLILK